MQETLFSKKDPREFAIPIMPHLKKFVLKTYRSKEPVKIEERNMLGRCVMMVLQDKRKKHDDRSMWMNSISGHHGNQEERDPMSARLRVVLNDSMMSRAPRIATLIRVNLHLKQLFNEAMIVWIEAQRKMGIPPNSAVKLFLEEYDIEESEYSYDAAAKYWTRYNNPILKDKK